MNIYESGLLRKITGKALRPGGIALTRRALDLCGFRPGARLLDLGCGPGATLELLRALGFSGLGLDCSAKLLAEARTHAPCIRGLFSRLPLADACLDGVLCECALSLAEDPARVMDECCRVLLPGGRLILADLALRDAGPQPAKQARDFPRKAGALPVSLLVRAMEARKFTLVHVEDHSRPLRELAAGIVWEYGSWAAFSNLCRNGDAPDAEGGCPLWEHPPENLVYILIIAEKRRT